MKKVVRKPLFFVVLVSLLSCCFSACEHQEILSPDTIIIGTGDEPGEYCCKEEQGEGWFGPPSYLTIVRFAEPEMKNKVILQHPFKRYNETEGQYEYYEDKGLYMNVLPQNCERKNGCGLPLSLVNWSDEQLHIAGTSPYIPLAKGYYLIDWKWHQLLPLSAIAGAWTVVERHNHFAELLQDHVFLIDTEWQDLTDFSIGYDTSIYTQHVKGLEIIRVWIMELTCLYNEELSDPYICWNNSLYYFEGMCFENMQAYDVNGDCTHSGKTYRTYINYCDSLQNIYQQRLIELINNGQIKKVGY